MMNYLEEEKIDKATTIRRMSYSSAALAMGNMPREVNMTDPTIIVLLSFKRDAFPSEDDLLPIIVRLFQYSERLSGIPDGTGTASTTPRSFYFRPVENLHPNQMVRTLHTQSCNNMKDLSAILQEQRKHYLRCPDRSLPWWEFVRIENCNINGNGESFLCLRLDHTIGDGFSVGNIFANILSEEDGTLLDDFVPASMKVNKQQMLAGQSRCSIAWKGLISILNIGMLPISSFDSPTAFSKNVSRADVVRQRMLFELLFVDTLTLLTLTSTLTIFTFVSRECLNIHRCWISLRYHWHLSKL
mmetsp:Transcript_26395/g.30674  ORF Transcript_26395/g.30674 Transcript_26395/m.30674 type:complete len:300 (-) Transcript_26395:29-928(-)